MKAVAYAPGHITGFFQPLYHEDIYKTGSRGAGINLNLGVKTIVEILDETNRPPEIYLNKQKIESPLIIEVVNQLMKNQIYHLSINIKTELPIGQGFGMSAAGTLSTAYAIAELKGQSKIKAIKAAHYAEITQKTGLGDVVAASVGGFEIREKPGLPPYGCIKKINGSWDITTCVIEDSVSTPKILQNQSLQKKIISLGKNCTDNLLKDPTIENFFDLSRKFAFTSGLVHEKVKEAIELVELNSKASMCMLGNSIFILGINKNIINELKQFGTPYTCKVDEFGARILY